MGAEEAAVGEEAAAVGTAWWKEEEAEGEGMGETEGAGAGWVLSFGTPAAAGRSWEGGGGRTDRGGRGERGSVDAGGGRRFSRAG